MIMHERPPVILSDRQKWMLTQAAARAFAPGPARDAFITDVKKCLFGEPSDQALMAALNAQMDRIPTEHLYNDG
jgi:hypothetical protein